VVEIACRLAVCLYPRRGLETRSAGSGRIPCGGAQYGSRAGLMGWAGLGWFGLVWFGLVQRVTDRLASRGGYRRKYGARKIGRPLPEHTHTRYHRPLRLEATRHARASAQSRAARGASPSEIATRCTYPNPTPATHRHMPPPPTLANQAWMIRLDANACPKHCALPAYASQASNPSFDSTLDSDHLSPLPSRNLSSCCKSGQSFTPETPHPLPRHSMLAYIRSATPHRGIWRRRSSSPLPRTR
jgi:hypothetical protein